MWMSILTTVLNISLMIPVIGSLEGRNVQEWKFKANDKLAYLAVTVLNQQRVISLLRCDVACSQHPDCTITVYNRSSALCTKFRLFREQDITPTILTGNFDVRHFGVNVPVPSCLSQPPPLQNANASDGSQLVGSIRTYTCHKGYRDMLTKKGTANSVCLGNLTWSRVALQCLAERCPSKLPSFQNADISRGSRNVGSSRRYTCHRGYRDKSTGLNIAQTRCLQSLRWSRPNLSCSAQSCPSKPPHIENAHVSGRGNVVGSVRKYTCHKSYMDTSYPKGTNKAKCRENFRWSQPGLRCTGPWLRKETKANGGGWKYTEFTKEELKQIFADSTFIFQVKTCYNAIFNYDKYTSRKNLEDKIIIGGGNNTYWKIYPCYQIEENDIVSCKEFRSFWIRFHGNIVQAGKGNTVGEREVISCEHNYTVNHLRISTYVRNHGKWLFKIHGG